MTVPAHSDGEAPWSRQLDRSPLEGVRILELSAIGPAPFGVMLLGDLGAEVIRVDRRERGEGEVNNRGISRNRRSVAVDLKRPKGQEIVLRLADHADVLVEGFRPGVAERLGVGPQVCRSRNGRLIYTRMSGWGQTGPRASSAGHDLNFASLAGAIHPMGRAGEPPAPPLNLVADFGGGGTYLAIGVLAALMERERSGRGQVVDVAMVDGVASLTSYLHGLAEVGRWEPGRARNRLDGSAPFYDTYATADQEYIAVAANEPEFYNRFLSALGLEPQQWPQFDRARWPALKREVAAIVSTRTRADWIELFDDRDACVSPVLHLDEAPFDEHLMARETFVEFGGVLQPAPAPRLSRTPGTIRSAAPQHGQHTSEVLMEIGYSRADLEALFSDDVIGPVEGPEASPRDAATMRGPR